MGYFVPFLAVVVFVVVVTVYHAWRMKRRHSKVAATRPATTRKQFTVTLAGRGCDTQVAEAIWDELIDFYVPPLTPYPDDSMSLLLDIDPGDLEDIAARLFERLQLPMPTATNPEHIPPIATILDLASYLTEKMCDKA